MSIEIVRYHESQAEQWDAFVAQSRNGTAFHSRRFLSYHPHERFTDHSLLLRKDGHIVALLPAAEIVDQGKKSLISHPGASYGGLVLASDCSVADTGAVIDAILAYARSEKFTGLSLLRLTPSSVRRQYADDQEYWIFQRGGSVSRLEMDGSIDLSGWHEDKLLEHFSGKCRNAVRQAQRSGLKVKITEDWEAFWIILEATLASRHATKPTHDLPEIRRLKAQLGDELRLFAAFDDQRMVGGIVTVALHSGALYTLYIAQDYAAQKVHPVHLVLTEVIRTCLLESRNVLHLGVSTEDGGKVVNEGLFFFKESFGMKPVRRESWTITL